MRLLPDYFTIGGLEYALPYSRDNQQFLELIEQGRIPWEQLRELEGLHAMCEGRYGEGAITVEVEDRRAPREASALDGARVAHGGVRQLTLRADDDSLLQANPHLPILPRPPPFPPLPSSPLRLPNIPTLHFPHPALLYVHQL